jgi:hypothetical protein
MDFDKPSDDELKELEREIATYPEDLLRRFRLAEALCKRRDYGAAIPELQKAMSSPHVRLSALKLLVEAFEAKRMFDLAARFREQLSKESGEDSDSGSAAIPAPTRPKGPHDSSQSEKRPHDDDKAI